MNGEVLERTQESFIRMIGVDSPKWADAWSWGWPFSERKRSTFLRAKSKDD